MKAWKRQLWVMHFADDWGGSRVGSLSDFLRGSMRCDLLSQHFDFVTPSISESTKSRQLPLQCVRRFSAQLASSQRRDPCFVECSSTPSEMKGTLL
eukprot:1151130-Rhodomonas_salina.2